jgi:hypothetical protein
MWPQHIPPVDSLKNSADCGTILTGRTIFLVFATNLVGGTMIKKEKGSN